MIRRVVDFALGNRLLILGFALLLFAWGIVSFHNLPIEAYPDVADNYVEIITQWPGISAEQIEQQVTIPLEVAMNGIPGVVHLRSFSLFGLSDLKLIFEDGTDNAWNRERVLERLSQVTLPPSVVPQMGTDWSPVGQIYFFTLHSTNPKYDAMELKSIEDWVVEKNLKSVPDIVDVASFGGPTREYQVRLDPDKLVSYGLSLAQVEQQLTNNNANAGGSFIQAGLQQINVREVGLVDRVHDIKETVILTKNGTPLRMKDIAVVAQGPKIRLGQFARACSYCPYGPNGAIRHEDGKIIDNDDVVSGIALLRKGAPADPALKALEAKIQEMNDHILPKGVKIVPFINRSDLVHFTSHTVLHNLTEGMILVSIILFLFLGNVRGALIVAATIPFSLLFASICLDLKQVPANLLSLGALDFGMVVDGAVVMIENIVRHMSFSRGTETPLERIGEAAHEVQRPVFYAIGIIITAYLPIFTLQRVEGRLFQPMAWTVAFALLGALIFSMLIAPVLASFAFAKGAKEWHNPIMYFLTERYRSAVRWAIRHRAVTIGVALFGVALGMYLAFSGVIGSEFLPHLDEGALWVRGTLAPSTGPDEGIRVANQARVVLCSFPEVPQCTSQVGRPDDGTDTTGFFNTEYFVDLKPKEEWRPIFHENKDELIAAMQRELDKIPGAVWGFSQPIEDNMEEAVSGVKGELATKVFGDDLHTLEDKADQIVTVMRKVQGIEDLGVFRVLGQPNMNISVDRDAAARYQINVADVQDAIQTAVGGNALTQVLQGEARYDLVLRYLPQYRDTREAIERIRLLSPSGERVSLAQLCKTELKDGGSEIYREGNQRYIAIKYSVRGRDLGSAVEEAISKVGQQVQLPTGYHLKWEGEYASQKRANQRLLIVLPITILIIFIILYTMFKSFKWALLIMANVAIAPIGGLLALLLTGTNFSVSSGVGFLALFGVCVQTGVIMLEYINQLRVRRYTIEDAAVEGAELRLRPIMMTMLVATLGLLPAAMSHAIGSDSQRPFAIVIVGGLVAALAMSIFLLPTLYVWVASDHDVLPSAEPGFAEGEHVD
ncbi:MAG TPA: CusA/CzcA family heavy metal efflux RND transporter [Candidatus Sulfotelmatobacter sp.]|nr:CusA/CzcA family heavy metal efflux RND transporter [Candidatus Sulfotelmatobacter sp.]